MQDEEIPKGDESSSQEFIGPVWEIGRIGPKRDAIGLQYADREQAKLNECHAQLSECKIPPHDPFPNPIPVHRQMLMPVDSVMKPMLVFFHPGSRAGNSRCTFNSAIDTYTRNG